MSSNNNRLPAAPENARTSRKEGNGSYAEYIRWYALPRHDKIKEGLETQKAFAEYHGVDEKTLWRWSRRADFIPRAEELIRMWVKARKPDIVGAIYAAAMKGNPLSQMLWLKAFEGFTEKQEVVHSQKVELGPNDFRFIIDGMPEPERSKFYGYLREIIDHAVALRNSGRLADEPRPEQYNESPQAIPDEADNDAPDAPRPAADALAGSDSCGIRENMVWEVQPHNHQSATRWW